MGSNPWVGKIPWRRKLCFSILAWEILWTEEPGGLQSMGRGTANGRAQLTERAHTHISHTHTQGPPAVTPQAPRAWEVLSAQLPKVQTGQEVRHLRLWLTDSEPLWKMLNN